MIDFRIAPHRAIAGKNIVEVLLNGKVVAMIASYRHRWHPGCQRAFQQALVGRVARRPGLAPRRCM